jgi:hypothetical protein
MSEIYRIIPDTEEMYSVSNYGNIRNNSTNFVLNPYLTERGYLQVCLPFSSKDKRVTVNIHRLVARAFVENPFEKEFVNHIDCCKTNNTATNLEWVTPSENNLHAVANGLIPQGEDSYLHILKESEVLIIIEKLIKGSRNIDLAKEYNVAPNTIDDIRCNRTWRHIQRNVICGNGPKRKLVAEDIPEIRKLFISHNNSDIARRYGVATATIREIKIGNTWKNY